MNMHDDEAVAGLRILVGMAQADGTIHEEERAALRAAMEGMKLPSGTTLETLLSEKVNLEAEMAKIRTPEARSELYASLSVMARADGEASPAEEKMLSQAATTWKLTSEETTFLSRLLHETKDTLLPSHIAHVADPQKREKEIQEDVLKYSLLSAVLGAFPIPGVAIATDLAVVALQVKMVRDIGQYWGHTVGKEAAKSMLYGVGLGTGARMAVNNIVKFVPGWGSAFAAVSSFAATFALGKVMNQYFADGKTFDETKMKSEFKNAEAEGKSAFEANKARVDKLAGESKAKMAAWGKDLKDGKMSPEEYEKNVASLK